jgi:hypothetical protein
VIFSAQTRKADPSLRWLWVSPMQMIGASRPAQWARLGLASLGQRDVGVSWMLPGKRPCGLSVAQNIDAKILGLHGQALPMSAV